MYRIVYYVAAYVPSMYCVYMAVAVAVPVPVVLAVVVVDKRGVASES